VIQLDRDVPRGTELEVPVEALPPTEEGEYYAFQLVGLDVIEEGGRRLGQVVAVEPGVANDSIALDSGLLLPARRGVCPPHRSRGPTYPCRSRLLRRLNPAFAA
jgi:ribosomal 30S subunit maturation factor RimM